MLFYTENAYNSKIISVILIFEVIKSNLEVKTSKLSLPSGCPRMYKEETNVHTAQGTFLSYFFQIKE